MESSFCSCEEEMGSLKRWEIWRDGKFGEMGNLERWEV